MNSRSIGLGLLFGFLLSRVGATSYDAISGMFALTDLHLVGVIGLAIAVAAIGFGLFRRFGIRARGGAPLALAKKPYGPGVIWGGLLFGAGWAIAGTCPGTALAQIGEGRLAGIVTFIGIVLGAYAQNRVAVAGARARPRASGGVPPAVKAA
jgi:uncharacterized membrane protein YedE/YeeE